MSDWRFVATMSDIDTAILTLANEIDMSLSGEVRMTGRTDAGTSAALSKANDICQLLGVPGMAECARPRPKSGGELPIPRKIRPEGSVRLQGAQFVNMFNSSFFQMQKSQRTTEDQSDLDF
jgi:hypothetical protein